MKTRELKIPPTIQFMRLEYEYQSLKDVDLHNETRIAVNRFKPAIERINGRSFSNAEIESIIDEIHYAGLFQRRGMELWLTR